MCRECSRKRSKLYYKENTELHKKNTLKRNKIIRRSNQDKVIEILLKSPCVDCGETRLQENISFTINFQLY